MVVFMKYMCNVGKVMICLNLYERRIYQRSWAYDLVTLRSDNPSPPPLTGEDY